MIIINRMFTGSYLKDNIGHECINLFQADDGGNYLYLNANGKFDGKNKWDKDCDNYMLMVRRFDKGVLQVIAKAKIKSIATKDNVSTDTASNPKKIYIGDMVKYNDVTLRDIFSGNVKKRGQNVDPNQQQVTFVADSVVFAKEMLLLTTGDKIDGCVCLKGSVKHKTGSTSFKFSSSSLRQYVIEKDVPDVYTQLKGIIDNNTLWGNSPGKIDCSSFHVRPTTLFEIIHKENDELMYSDMIKFYLDDEEFAEFFVENVLDVKLEADERIKRVDREEFNIDLLIRTNKRLIVIENKIHSGINGLEGRIDDQISNAMKAIDIDSDFQIVNEDSIVPSQLTKYYIYAQLLKVKDYWGCGKPNSYFMAII